MLWAASGRVAEWLGFSAGAEIPQTVVFVGLRSLLTTLINLPWSVYFTFWVEQKHGFNKQVCVCTLLLGGKENYSYLLEKSLPKFNKKPACVTTV